MRDIMHPRELHKDEQQHHYIGSCVPREDSSSSSLSSPSSSSKTATAGVLGNRQQQHHLQFSENGLHALQEQSDGQQGQQGQQGVYTPVSPGTRCPSLSESLLSCASPKSHGLATPGSERGSITSPSGSPTHNASKASHHQRDGSSSGGGGGVGVGSGSGSRSGSGGGYLDPRHHQLHHQHQHSGSHRDRISKPYQLPSHIRIRGHSPLLAHNHHHQHHDNNHHYHHHHHHPKDRLEKHEKRRISHLNSEKKRRESIKGGMDALLELVPGCRDVRLSKANVLREAREYILELRGGFREMEEEIERQRRENEDLRRAIGSPLGQDHRFGCRI